MSTSIHASLDPNSSRANDAREQTPKTGAPDTRRPGRDICHLTPHLMIVFLNWYLAQRMNLLVNLVSM